MKRIVWILGWSWIGTSSAIGLQEYLEQVKQKNGILEAVPLSKEAADAKTVIGDFALSPYVTAKALTYDDKAKQLSPFQGTRTEGQEYSLGIAKKFASGTGLSLTYGQKKTVLTGAPFVVTEPWANALTLGVSQSLWKDFFGAGTRLRRERESNTARLEKLAQEIQSRQTLIAAENAYWDAVYDTEELRVRKTSMERAKRLMTWVQNRLDSGIGDVSDLLQAQSANSLREMQLLTAVDEQVVGRRKLADQIQSNDLNSLQDVQADYNEARDLSKIAGSDSPVRIDALAKTLESNVRKSAAEEFSEGLKPDLSLQASYALNARRTQYSQALGDTFETDYPTKSIGLTLSMDLDRGAVSKARAGMDAEARAADAKNRQARFESNSAWTELVRRHQVLSERIKVMEKLTKINLDRMKRENERLRVGRTTTFQVINFEQESDETEILLVKLKTERRKLESQARLFVNPNFSEDL
jgi:outer membrane protein TolC